MAEEEKEVPQVWEMQYRGRIPILRGRRAAVRNKEGSPGVVLAKFGVDCPGNHYAFKWNMFMADEFESTWAGAFKDLEEFLRKAERIFEGRNVVCVSKANKRLYTQEDWIAAHQNEEFPVRYFFTEDYKGG